MSERYLAAENIEWIDPRVRPAPLGTTILCFTDTGTCTKGRWDNEARYLAWAPLPKMPLWLKERMRERWQTPT